MTEPQNTHPIQHVQSAILTVRGQKVILDVDLARTYGVPTKVLNQAVKRNADRFPDDFMFRLSKEETENLRRSRSQSVTLKRGQNVKYPPYAFTEHGAIMAATVLNSPQAVRMSVFVVRAFVKMREHMLHHVELQRKLADIEKSLMAHDAALRDVYLKIRPLLLPPSESPRRQIGFGVKERRARYMVKRKDK